MALPDIKEVRNLSLAEIQNEIVLIKRQLFDLQFKKATKQNVKTHLFKHTRHRLAQLKFVQHEYQINKLN
uniref:Large ribosomal subunit protein uL29c n=1 Tax=Bangiopsis subsimplex TaxID=139980 RepID=A0A1C9CCZ7_9RHOD|nr:ribosomal protein L29 [Bangiopsis subsimplex]AOM66268.1 ribosomal protein L29 [Bangiopsis subsimplex]ARO90370.1 50S ribosomal protein L29 [Bangiopsis subsimplex]